MIHTSGVIVHLSPKSYDPRGIYLTILANSISPRRHMTQMLTGIAVML